MTNIIDRGLAHLEREGWHQLPTSQTDTSVRETEGATAKATCLWVSIARCDVGNTERVAAKDALAAELGIPDNVNTLDAIFDFNDARSTTFEDIRLVMKRASARLDRGES